MKQLIWAGLLLCLSVPAWGQSLSLSLQQESATLPFMRFVEWHPGGELSYEFARVENQRGYRQFAVTGGYFHHRKLTSAAYVKGSYRWAWQQEKVAWELGTSVGYLHSFYPGNVYEQVEGEFVAKTQYGRPHALIEGEMGIRFFPTRQIQPFVRYRFGIETPFANGIPVFPHSFYQIGLSYQLGQ